MEEPNARVTLSIAVSLGVEARLVIANAGASPVLVDRAQLGLDGSLENDVFTIVALGDPGRPKLEYTGRLVKRGPPDPEDCALLEPGQAIGSSVRLDRFYAFLKGKHQYEATYSAYLQDPGGSGLRELASNEARFVFDVRVT